MQLRILRRADAFGKAFPASLQRLMAKGLLNLTRAESWRVEQPSFTAARQQLFEVVLRGPSSPEQPTALDLQSRLQQVLSDVATNNTASANSALKAGLTARGLGWHAKVASFLDVAYGARACGEQPLAPPPAPSPPSPPSPLPPLPAAPPKLPGGYVKVVKVVLEDRFGDGWGDVMLLVTRPGGEEVATVGFSEEQERRVVSLSLSQGSCYDLCAVDGSAVDAAEVSWRLQDCGGDDSGQASGRPVAHGSTRRICIDDSGGCTSIASPSQPPVPSQYPPRPPVSSPAAPQPPMRPQPPAGSVDEPRTPPGSPPPQLLPRTSPPPPLKHPTSPPCSPPPWLPPSSAPTLPPPSAPLPSVTKVPTTPPPPTVAPPSAPLPRPLPPNKPLPNRPPTVYLAPWTAPLPPVRLPRLPPPRPPPPTTPVSTALTSAAERMAAKRLAAAAERRAKRLAAEERMKEAMPALFVGLMVGVSGLLCIYSILHARNRRRQRAIADDAYRRESMDAQELQLIELQTDLKRELEGMGQAKAPQLSSNAASRLDDRTIDPISVAGSASLANSAGLSVEAGEGVLLHVSHNYYRICVVRPHSTHAPIGHSNLARLTKPKAAPLVPSSQSQLVEWLADDCD